MDYRIIDYAGRFYTKDGFTSYYHFEGLKLNFSEATALRNHLKNCYIVKI